jgi:predicted  nucleic acid-binding Zn-ribbon protein
MEDNKVAILLEDLRSQFRTFGEGLQLVNEKMDREFTELKADVTGLKTEVTGLKMEVTGLKVEVREMKDQNRQEHLMLKQMIQDVATDQAEMKKKLNDLDREFEIELRRIK